MAVPKIFAYDNYREYLKEIYSHKKEEGRGFSFRNFSRKAGFASPNYLKLVMNGDRNLSDEGAKRVSQALHHSPSEEKHFCSLVKFNQSQTSGEKQKHYESLLKSKTLRHLQPLLESQFNYFTRWYYVAIRELIGTKDFKNDPAWIAQTLHPRIHLEEAHVALLELLNLGLIERTPEGNLKQTHTQISTGNEVQSLALKSFHREMMKLAAESMDTVPREERDISSVTVVVDQERLLEIKSMIQSFRKDLLATVSKSVNPKLVYQINFQFFPLVGKDSK